MKANQAKTIALIRPNYDSHIITPPLGIGYLASYLKSKGHQALIIDALNNGLSNQQIIDILNRENISIVGITCLTAFYEEVVELSNLLKANNKMVIIGGVHPTFLPKQTLVDTNADYIICGEGEIAFSHLLANDLNNEGIKGVYGQNDLNNSNITFKNAEIVENLDDIPFPDWEQINPNTYPQATHGFFAKNFPIGFITSTRGCPYSCKFCASPSFYKKRIRFRSPENIIEEIKYLINHIKVKEIHFEDDNLTFDRNHISEICNLILENKIKINWGCPNGIRADKVDDELIKLMKKAGCYFFFYGIESSNDKILKNINKGESSEVIRKSIKLAKKNQIICNGFFVFGLPGETKESIKESIQFAIDSKLDLAQFLILDVLPGCELWNELEGQFKPNFKKDSYREPEWIPENLTHNDLIKAQKTAFRRFYSRPKVILNMIKMIKPKQIIFLMKRIIAYRFFDIK